jgi:hypothetical protein
VRHQGPSSCSDWPTPPSLVIPTGRCRTSASSRQIWRPNTTADPVDPMPCFIHPAQAAPRSNQPLLCGSLHPTSDPHCCVGTRRPTEPGACPAPSSPICATLLQICTRLHRSVPPAEIDATRSARGLTRLDVATCSTCECCSSSPRWPGPGAAPTWPRFDRQRRPGPADPLSPSYDVRPAAPPALGGFA